MTKKEKLEQSQKAIGEFLKLAKYLLSENAPESVSDIPQDSPYYEDFKFFAKEASIEWTEDMNPVDSDYLILTVLSDYFCAIEPDEEYEPVISITYKKSE